MPRLISPTNLLLARKKFQRFISLSFSCHCITRRVSLSSLATGEMIPRMIIARQARQALQCSRNGGNSRHYATAASGSFDYEAGEAAGVKLASRDLPRPTTHLAVVAKAGTRFQPLPGFSEGLEQFAFKSTDRRSSLRINRETELLGGELSSYHSRENLVISAKFLREDLAYFTELLGEVVSKTKYTCELHPCPYIYNTDFVQLMNLRKRLSQQLSFKGSIYWQTQKSSH